MQLLQAGTSESETVLRGLGGKCSLEVRDLLRAFIEGIGWALAVATGRPSPISGFHEFASAEQLRGQDRGSRVRGDPDHVAGTEGALHGSSCAHSAERPSAPPAGHDVDKGHDVALIADPFPR